MQICFDPRSSLSGLPQLEEGKPASKAPSFLICNSVDRSSGGQKDLLAFRVMVRLEHFLIEAKVLAAMFSVEAERRLDVLLQTMETYFDLQSARNHF